MPELAACPFPQLQHFTFEGEVLPIQLANFILKDAVNHLETLSLATEEFTMEFKGTFKHDHKSHGQNDVQKLFMGCEYMFTLFSICRDTGHADSSPKARAKDPSYIFWQIRICLQQ